MHSKTITTSSTGNTNTVNKFLAASAMFFALPIAGLAALSTNAHAAPGDLDSTFNGSGFVSEHRMLDFTTANSTIADINNYVVTAYSAYDSTRTISKHYIARYKPSGALDTSFGAGGYANLTISDLNCDPVVVEDASTNLLVASCDDANILVWRFKNNGALDTSYGSGGVGRIAVNSVTFPVIGLATYRDFALVTLGTTMFTGTGPAQPHLFTLGRLNPSGNGDTTLAGTGLVRFPMQATGANERSLSTDVKMVGRNIVLGGRTRAVSTDPWKFALARLTWSGTLDPSFAGVGYMNFPVATGQNRGRKIAIDTRSRIVITGTASLAVPAGAPAEDYVGVARVLPTGVLDASFGVGGVNLLGGGSAPTGGFCTKNTYAFDVTTFKDRILITGFCDRVTGGVFGVDTTAYVLRLNSVGNYDTTFGSTANGYTYYNFSGFPTAQLYAIRTDKLGQIITAGNEGKSDGTGLAVTARMQQ